MDDIVATKVVFFLLAVGTEVFASGCLDRNFCVPCPSAPPKLQQKAGPGLLPEKLRITPEH